MNESTNSLAAEPPPTEARVSLRALFVLTTLTAIGAAGFGILLRPLPPEKQIAMALFAGFCALLVLGTAIVLGALRRRAERLAGAVLFQFPIHSYFLPRAPRLMSMASGVLLFALGALVSLGGAWAIIFFRVPGQGPYPFMLIGILPQLIFSMVQFGWLIALGMACIWWSGPARFCDKGLVRRQQFVAWSACKRHYWDAVNPDVLVIYWGIYTLAGRTVDQASGKLTRVKLREYPPSGQIAVRVPASEREAVAAFLKNNLTSSNLNSAAGDGQV